MTSPDAQGDTPRVAFCGLGRMGVEMVAALIDSGLKVTVWNRTSHKATEVAEATGATFADTPADASADADVVVIMLTDGRAVLDVLDGPDGCLARLGKEAVVVDCSTTGAELAGAAAELCARSGVAFVDCPVSGSTQVARRGELGLMAGGDADVIDRLRPVLEALGSSVVRVGPNGAGAAAKVAVNGLLHTFNTALAENLVVARSAGVSPDAFFDVLAGGVLWNRFLDYKRAAFTDPAHSGVAFDLTTATKDLSLAWAASRKAGLAGSVVERTLELHEQALGDGYGDRDMAAMATWFADADRPSSEPTAARSDTDSERT